MEVLGIPEIWQFRIWDGLLQVPQYSAGYIG